MPARSVPDRPFPKKIAIASIHDVMPANLDRIIGIISFLRDKGVGPITLLVVPGKNWRPGDIATLERLQKDGDIEFAGHGWQHEIDGFGSLWHRLHGFLMSRREAEHLSLDAHEIVDLIHRNHDWFVKAGLKAPDLYVPPAWAMGKITRKALESLPYRYYESLTGVYDAGRRAMQRMGVCGYMADTRPRAFALRATNAANQIAPLPLRIAIHPEDLELLLAADLSACLGKNFQFLSYGDFFR